LIRRDKKIKIILKHWSNIIFRMMCVWFIFVCRRLLKQNNASISFFVTPALKVEFSMTVEGLKRWRLPFYVKLVVKWESPEMLGVSPEQPEDTAIYTRFLTNYKLLVSFYIHKPCMTRKHTFFFHKTVFVE